MKTLQLSPISLVTGSAATACLLLLTGMQGQVSVGSHQAAPPPDLPVTQEQQEILNHMSLVYLDDGLGGTVKTLRISGINVQIVNGLGRDQRIPRPIRTASSANGDPGRTAWGT